VSDHRCGKRAKAPRTSRKRHKGGREKAVDNYWDTCVEEEGEAKTPDDHLSPARRLVGIVKLKSLFFGRGKKERGVPITYNK